MIIEDLKKAIQIMNSNWVKQNNILDYKTKFIYDIKDYDSLIKVSHLLLSKENDIDYAIHRWINLQISNACEELFCKYGAIKVENKKDKEKDIYINNIPFDVKVTNYPSTAYEHFNLDTNDGKAELATWLYNNQSNEGRQHFKNRLFVVCCGDDSKEKWENRINLDLLENGIKEFMTSPKFISLEDLNVICNIIIIR